MIRSRQEILSINSCYSKHLIEVQKAKYKPNTQWEEGESLILENDNEPITLSKEQADKLNAEDLIYYQDNKDHYSVKHLHHWIKRHTIISSQKTPHTYLHEIGEALANLSKHFGKLIIMGDWNTPLLHQKNDYLPVLEAIKYLRKQIDEKFNGGFILGKNEIYTFIPHLFWLTRCNASLPEFMISFESSKTIFNLCKYGVLHIEYYDEKEAIEIDKLFNRMKFEKVIQCNDPVMFDDMISEKTI